MLIYPVESIGAKPGRIACIQVHEKFEDGIG